MKIHHARPIVVAIGCALGGCYGGLDGTDPVAEGGADGAGSADDAADDGDGDGDDGEVPPTVECDGEVLDPGPNLARRLTQREYTNTVEALLSVDVRAEAVEALPAELRADGFSNSASGLITTLRHVEGYAELAELAVSRIPDLAGLVGQYTDCTEFSDACERPFVEGLGLRAFRRPLTTEETDLLVGAFAAAETEGQTFLDGAGLVIEAMMQSPPFLYRLEDETIGEGSRALGGYEMASRLSYLLWAGPPDEVLLAAAADDALSEDDEIVAQVERMLAEPAAVEASLGFLHDWLNHDRLANLPRDPAQFPEWSSAIADAMGEETRAFFRSVAWDQQRPLTDLFVAQETWLTPELADYYGLESGAPGMSQLDVSDIPERGGLLTQGSMLTIGGDSAGMVARGLFIFEHILCAHPASPPEGIDTTPPDVGMGASQRDHSEARLANPDCMGCHLQFEPPAFGLGRYLGDGRYATEDFYGNALREDGEMQLPGEPAPEPFMNAREMMEILAGSDAVRECLTKKGAQFAIARPLMPSDACSMDKVMESFDASNGSWHDLVVAIALSPGFRSIRVES